MERSITLTASHPQQGPSTKFNDYFLAANFYYNMIGLVENIRVSLGHTYSQDRFIAHLQNATAIEEQVRRERASPDPQDCHKYSNSMYVQHITSIAHSLPQISAKTTRSFGTSKLHSMESTLHVLDGQDLYEYGVYGIDLDDCDSRKC